MVPVADPGFPRGGCANSPGGGGPTYEFAKFSQKLNEIEINSFHIRNNLGENIFTFCLMSDNNLLYFFP